MSRTFNIRSVWCRLCCVAGHRRLAPIRESSDIFCHACVGVVTEQRTDGRRAIEDRLSLASYICLDPVRHPQPCLSRRAPLSLSVLPTCHEAGDLVLCATLHRYPFYARSAERRVG